MLSCYVMGKALSGELSCMRTGLIQLLRFPVIYFQPASYSYEDISRTFKHRMEERYLSYIGPQRSKNQYRILCLVGLPLSSILLLLVLCENKWRENKHRNVH